MSELNEDHLRKLLDIAVRRERQLLDEIAALRKSPWVRNTPETRPAVDGKEVLMRLDRFQLLGTFKGTKWIDEEGDTIEIDAVIWWMPIPEPPKEGT